MSSKMAEKLAQAVGDNTAHIALIEENKSQEQILEVLRWGLYHNSYCAPTLLPPY